MRIAFVVYDDVPDGTAMAHRVHMLAQGLVSWGHEVHILVPYRFSPGPLTAEIDGVKIHWGCYTQRKTSEKCISWFAKKRTMFRNCRQLLSQGFDWLIMYDIGIEGLLYVYLGKIFKCRLAADNCDIIYFSSKQNIRMFLTTLSDRIGHLLVDPYLHLNFAISKVIDDYLGLVAPRVPRVMVRPPVDLNKFKKREKSAHKYRQKYGLEGSIVIGYFGSIWAAKGLEQLLQAAQRVLASGNAFKLMISGNADKNAYLMRRIDELSLRNDVVLTGYLSTDDLITAMSVPDILVEPKIAEEENWAAFPQKVAEYLAMGTAIVASAIGDIPQYLHDQENAILCQPGDSSSLAAALERLIEDKGLRNKLAARARETAQQFFDARLIARNIETALLQIN
jgi:glycosyltransferase involved in cell wall biosynthesis